MENHNQEKIYTCPMHPEVIGKEGDKCPKCKMDLVAKGDAHSVPEHDKHAGHSVLMFRDKFFVSLIASAIIVFYSDIFYAVFSQRPFDFAGAKYIVLILSIFVFFYGGAVFIKGAIRELKSKMPGMMTLISLAIITAFVYSAFIEIGGLLGAKFTGQSLFWELATLITIMLLGHWLEMRAVEGSEKSLRELSKLLPDTAEVIIGRAENNGQTQKIKIAELKIGDIILVRPGARVPADGMVIDGKSEVDESMITGESAPVLKSMGSEAIAGTINGDGVLKIKVTKIGEQTFLAGVMRLVAEAQLSKSKLQLLSDRAAFYLTIIAIVAGFITFSAWMIVTRDVSFAIERLVAVLVIACPHALGLAVPLVASISTAIGAKNGLLVKKRLALEDAKKIDVVLFDKTGTLTMGEFGVEKVWCVGTEDEKEILRLAASVDANSEHAASRAIVKASKMQNIELIKVDNFLRLPGKGVSGDVSGDEILVGGFAILGDKSADLFPKELVQEIEVEKQKGKTINFVLKNKKIIGAISLGDVIRKESKEAISELKRMGVQVMMITGDSENTARWVASELGVEDYFSQVLPGEKAGKVRLLQLRGLKVAVVGDGINDAPALMQADLGVAIGAGTNVAIESAGIILIKDDPRDIIKIIGLSKATYRKMVENLFWATGYNIVALPLATGALAYWGILLEPAVAAIFMSASTIIVAFNAMRLKFAKI